MQKLFNFLSAISFLLVLAISGGGIFAYLWINNPTNQNKIKGQVIESVKDSLKIPGMTGGAKPMKGLSSPSSPLPF